MLHASPPRGLNVSRRDSPRDLPESELDALVACVSDGDREAFTALFRALHPRALRVVSGRIDAARAEEVAQSSMVKLFANASAFTPGRPVLPWFYAIVANELRVELRRSKRPLGSVSETLPSHDPAPDEVLATRELRRALQWSLDALDPRSAEAIASLLNEEPLSIEPATYRKRLSRAYARLRTFLGGHYRA